MALVCFSFSYEFSHTTDRLWRKSRSKTRGFGLQNLFSLGCMGTDLNRNFGFHWRDVSPLHIQGGSDLPCTETYAGPNAWSEPESRAVRDFVLAHKNTIVVRGAEKENKLNQVVRNFSNLKREVKNNYQ